MNRIGALSEYKDRGEKKHATQRDAKKNFKKSKESERWGKTLKIKK